jgi:hypothetical protein
MPTLNVSPVKQTWSAETKGKKEVGYSFEPCRELAMIFPAHRSLPKLGNVLDNGIEYISPITNKPIRKITFLPLSIDYRKLRKNPAFLLDTEVRGADISNDIVSRLDPSTLPKRQRDNLAKLRKLMDSRQGSKYGGGGESSDKPEDIRRKMIICLRNLLVNLKTETRTKQMNNAFLKDGLSFGFAVSAKFLKGDNVPTTVRQTFQKFSHLKPENWFHVSPIQNR